MACSSRANPRLFCRWRSVTFYSEGVGCTSQPAGILIGLPAYRQATRQTMWGNTLIIDHLISPASSGDLQGKEEDKLVLSWEQRRWMRGRFTTLNGRKIGVALPTGTTLAPDSLLWIAPDWFLRVEAATEAVLEVTPSGYMEAIKIAFEVGNRHFPLAMQESKILVPDDKAMVTLMDRLGAPWQRRLAVFNPIGNTQGHLHG